jgi:hypothetical protein
MCVWRQPWRGNEHVERFPTTVRGLPTLTDRLQAHGVTQVAMEATGVRFSVGLGLMEVGVAIAAVVLLGAAGAALAVQRARKKDAPDVGDPYEALYPGRHERRAPLRRAGRDLSRGEGAGQPRHDR